MDHSLLAIFGSVLCFAQAAVIVRRFPPVHPVIMNGTGMLAGAVILFGASVQANEPFTLPERARPGLVIGGLLVLTGVYIGALRPGGGAAEGAEASA